MGLYPYWRCRTPLRVYHRLLGSYLIYAQAARSKARNLGVAADQRQTLHRCLCDQHPAERGFVEGWQAAHSDHVLTIHSAHCQLDPFFHVSHEIFTRWMSRPAA